MSAEKKPTEKRPITWADVEDIGYIDAYKKIEIVDGDWSIVDVPFYRRHNGFAATVHANLLRKLQRFVLLDGLGYVYPGRLGFVLDGTMDDIQLLRRTDISVVCELQIEWETIGEGVFKAHGLDDPSFIGVGHAITHNFSAPLFFAPNLAVEILYQDFADDMFQRIEDFLSHGTEQVWVVAPSSQVVWVYTQHGTAKAYRLGDTLSGGDLLPGFVLDIAKVFEM
jgi:Uma2 family endonuclease